MAADDDELEDRPEYKPKPDKKDSKSSYIYCKRQIQGAARQRVQPGQQLKIPRRSSRS